MREHNEAVNFLDVISGREPIAVDYAPGTVELVRQHDGSFLKLRKLSDDYNVHDRVAAMTSLQQRHAAGEIVTGLLYVDPQPDDLHQQMNTVHTPFNALGEAELCPGSATLDKLNASLR